MGVRLQLYPGADLFQVIVHVRMLDAFNRQQQEALGVLGVNLIYGVFYHYREPHKMIESLLENVGPDRIEVDMIHLSGPYFEDVDNRLMALHLVTAGLSHAVLFAPPGTVEHPGEALYKKNILLYRGSFRPVTHVTMDMVRCGRERFTDVEGVKDEPTLILAELTTANLMTGGNVDPKDFLARVDILSAMGFHVLVSNYLRFFRLRAFLNRYTKRRIRIVLGIPNVLDIFDEKYYEGMEGGILEAFGKLFVGDTQLYVYPQLGAEGELITVETLAIAPHLQHLLTHLLENRYIVPLAGCDCDILGILSRKVLDDIKRGDGAWRTAVPEYVYETIKSRRLFGYGSE